MRRDELDSVVRVRVRAVVVVAVAFVALMSIASLQGIPTFGDAPQFDATPPPFEASQTPIPVESSEPLPAEPNPWFGIIATVIGVLVAVLFAVLLIRFLVRAVREWWSARPLARADATTPDLEAGGNTVDESVAVPVIRRGIANALDAVEAHPDPRDAIIAAWVGLEESAERAVNARGATETAAEFTVRIVASRRSSASDVRALLRLYEHVRFGGFAADEQARAEARALLHRIEEQWR